MSLRPGREMLMAVGFKVGSIINEIGTASFFHSFFSTIAANLEHREWGDRFPVLLTKLYAGELVASDAEACLDELSIAQAELAKLTPDFVVWDFEDRSAQPPWGKDISPDITDLGNYFVTSTGRDLIVTLKEAVEELRDRGGVGTVVSY